MRPSRARPWAETAGGRWRGVARAAAAAGVLVTLVVACPSPAGADFGAVPYGVGSRPNSVAAGDMNGDGRLDLATANSASNDVTVLQAVPDGTYAAVWTQPAGLAPYALVAVDLNGDSASDLAVANLVSDNVSVLLGQVGSDTLKAAPTVTLGLGSSPTAVAAADFNVDGKADLAVANFTFGRVSVLLGRGDGTFEPERLFGVGRSPLSLVAGDLDGDSLVDLVSANSDSNDVSILRGQGNGTFVPAVSVELPPSFGSSPTSVVIADINGDGVADLAVTSLVAIGEMQKSLRRDKLFILQATAPGVFSAATALEACAPAGRCDPRSVAAADFNGDGRADLVTASDNLSVFLSTPTGALAAPATYASPLGPRSVLVASLNGDDRPDIAFASFGASAVSVLYGNPFPVDPTLPRGTFGASPSYKTGSRPRAVVAADVSGDAVTDLVVGNASEQSVSVLLGSGGGSFSSVGGPLSVGNFSPAAVAVADIDKDGLIDIVTANLGLQQGTVSVLSGLGDGAFSPPVVVASHGAFASSMAVADFDGDGQLDLALTYNDPRIEPFTDSPFVWMMWGTGNRTAPFALSAIRFPVGSRPSSVVAADLNGDGRTDLAVANQGPRTTRSTVSVLHGNAPGSPRAAVFTPQVQHPVGFSPSSVLAADLNSDSRPDLVVTNAGKVEVTDAGTLDDGAESSLSVLLATPEHSLLPASEISSGGGKPQSVIAADVNGDTRTDLAVVNANFLDRGDIPQVALVTTGSGVMSVLSGRGDGTFEPPLGYGVGSEPSGIAAGYYNGDDRLDLAVTNTRSGSVSVLLAVPDRPPTVPSPVLADPGNGMVTVTWGVPAHHGGSNITGYTVVASAGGAQVGDAVATAATTLKAVFTGLTNGTTYTFRVAATNAIGTGTFSPPSNPAVPAAVPGAPQSVSGSAGDASADVRWSPPADAGGQPVLSYTVTISGGEGPVPAVTVSGTTARVSGLVNGTAYTFQVAATNVVGTGPRSAPSEPVVPVAPVPPSAPASDPPSVPPSVSTVERPSSVASPGYALTGADGGVFAFGASRFLGSAGALRLRHPIVGVAATPGGGGYRLVAPDGGVFAFGNARFLGSTAAMALRSPIVGIASTPSGAGYWLVAADGGVFAFGDARFLGSAGAIALRSPIVGMAATPTGAGYRLVAADGGVFAFGDARFLGSTGAIALRSPIVGMAATPTGAGYRLVAADGGVFAFGDARFLGSTGAMRLNSPVVGIASTTTGAGYWLASADGGVFAFGDAAFLGSAAALRPNRPIVGVAARG